MIGKIDVQLDVLSSGFNRETCWVHSRPAFRPVGSPRAVVTMQKLRLTGNDVFQDTWSMCSGDGRGHWEEPRLESGLGRRRIGDGLEEGPSDITPGWHADSGKLLATGHTVVYRDDDLVLMPRPRSTIYSVWDDCLKTWGDWQKLMLPPDEEKLCMEGAGSTQRWDLPGGDILLPTYFPAGGQKADPRSMQYVSTILKCSFDGDTLRYVSHGSELTIPEGRGFVEPSITSVQGRFFLTLRNNEAGYVTAGDDGLRFNTPRRWIFDDGTDLGNYNTQQHWVTNDDELYLVYTRRGANNDHIMRHRAPLFIAQVDTERLCVIRATEQIVVPERGARLCNFGIAKVSAKETWITVAEWMQTKQPDPYDFTICEKYGSDNSIYLARLRFNL